MSVPHSQKKCSEGATEGYFVQLGGWHISEHVLSPTWEKLISLKKADEK